MRDETSVEHKGNHLVITVRGERRDLNQVIQGTKNIQEAVDAYDCRYVLADYRELIFNVSLTHAYNIVKVYDFNLPQFKDIVMAGVINESSQELGQFWESIAQKRGYNFKIYRDIAEANDWLQQQIQASASKSGCT